MRISRSEFCHEYETYSFGYTIHAELEPEDAVADAYAAGFLPASSDPSVRNRFYMARSVRVALPHFTPTSENRRVRKKFEGQFVTDILDRDALRSDPALRPCFLAYFADHHGQSVMSPERLEGILDTTLPLRAIRYTKDGVSVAYVLEVTGADFSHYWFSCYDLQYARSSLGMWLMLDAALRAKAEGLKYLYLGTAYGEKGRYKMNLTPLSFWDGVEWNAKEPLLKELIARDIARDS